MIRSGRNSGISSSYILTKLIKKIIQDLDFKNKHLTFINESEFFNERFSPFNEENDSSHSGNYSETSLDKLEERKLKFDLIFASFHFAVKGVDEKDLCLSTLDNLSKGGIGIYLMPSYQRTFLSHEGKKFKDEVISRGFRFLSVLNLPDNFLVPIAGVNCNLVFITNEKTIQDTFFAKFPPDSNHYDDDLYDQILSFGIANLYNIKTKNLLNQRGFPITPNDEFTEALASNLEVDVELAMGINKNISDFIGFEHYAIVKKIGSLDADYDGYKEKFKLKEYSDIFSGHYSRREDLKSSGKFLYLTPRHIQNKELVLSEKDKFIDNGEQHNKYILMPGDIIISSLWKTRKIYQYKSTDTPSIIGTNWIVLRTEINDYLSKYFEIKEFYEKFVLDCQLRLKGSVIPFLSCRDLKEIEIFQLSEVELLKKYKEEKLSKVQELELLSSIDKSTLEENQKEFIYELIKEYFADPIIKLSKQSESSHLEFKSSFRRDVEQGGKVPENEIIHSVLKTIGGFCNTGGGDLLIGVSDDNKIVGIEVDEFENQDKFLLALTQHMENKTTPDVMNLPDVINITFCKSDDKTICRVNVNPTPANVYVEYKNDDIFYKRKGPKTVPLRDRDLVKYIEQKNSMYE